MSTAARPVVVFFAFANDRTARAWAAEAKLLQVLVRTATAARLEPGFRVSSFGEPEDEAWKAWQQCISR